MPRPHVLRTSAAVLGSLIAVVLLVLGVRALSDATETRAESRPNSAASIVVFQIQVHGGNSEQARRLAAQDLWESCRRSTSADSPAASLDRLSGGVYAAVVRPALSSHDKLRLRGCLTDATANRATATVLGDGDAIRAH
ncbi:hypothetical protein [Streptomyces sp. NBC_01198]|uniref:hypothetical protein n=1 Tax=Streptomyces sp. NBC_01198 TaxID=2903769 RepID=UPI002E10538D|nr:hypothetical protein OG702_02435 [Streptomyces sp. NBC_01198]